MVTNQADSRSVSDISAPGKHSPPNFRVGERFNPFRLFDGIFIPVAICKYCGLSLGAKMVYGRLCRYAGEDGEAYPAVPTLGRELGISGKQARRYVRELEINEFIRADPDPGRRSHYVFLWHRVFSIGEVGTPRKAVPLPKMGDEVNHHQVIQEKSQQSERSVGRSMGGSGGEGETRNPNAKSKSKNFSQMGDDEKPKSRTRLQNPEMEFRARIAERHGTVVDADVLLRDVRAELDTVPLLEFLAADLMATTSPGKLSNPHGHYRTLARKLGRRKTTAVLESLAETVQQGHEFLKRGQPAAFKPSCTCNDGKLSGGGYCTCRVGQLAGQLAMAHQPRVAVAAAGR